MTTVNDVHSQLGKWKKIIIIDLYNAFFQNHINEDDQQWLGIMTPFSGLRVLTRSGQGLLGQSEELDELMAKILGDNIKEGRATKIQDDIIIGGQTQLEAARNYIKIKTYQCNHILRNLPNFFFLLRVKRNTEKCKRNNILCIINNYTRG